MADNDGTDILKCRWSTSNSSLNYNRIHECQGACLGLNGISTLSEDNCALVITLPVARSGWYFVIALQIEDYYNSTSIAPMSSVPIQFLFLAYTATNSCTTRPHIIGERPNRACIGTPINVSFTERVVAQVFCNGTTIVNFVTSSPIGMQHSNIVDQGNDMYQLAPLPVFDAILALARIFILTLTWTPVQDEDGPQDFCAGALDNNSLQSDAWCITYLVGFDSPDLIRIRAVQGSASPIGTIFSNHSLFSIQATRSVNRPTQNGTFMRFVNDTMFSSIMVWLVEWSSVVSTSRNFDDRICIDYSIFRPGPESAPITDPTFWRFHIWDSGLSSTTSTSTSPPTTGTVTTRPPLTTTANTLMTTTGIQVTTPITMTTTSVTSTASATTSTSVATTATIATTSVTGVKVFSSKDMEDACKQPVAIMTAVTSIVMMVVHSVAMFAMFTKMNKMFNPNQVTAVFRSQQRLRKP